MTDKEEMKPVEAIEKLFDRRRIIFLVRNKKLIAAHGQTAGGWGKVDDPSGLALKLFSREELQKIT